MNKLLKAVSRHESNTITSKDYKEFFKVSDRNSISTEFGHYFDKDLKELNKFIEDWHFGPSKIYIVTEAYWNLVPVDSLRQKMKTEGSLSGSAHYWPGRRKMWSILKSKRGV